MKIRQGKNRAKYNFRTITGWAIALGLIGTGATQIINYVSQARAQDGESTPLEASAFMASPFGRYTDFATIRRIQEEENAGRSIAEIGEGKGGSSNLETIVTQTRNALASYDGAKKGYNEVCPNVYNNMFATAYNIDDCINDNNPYTIAVNTGLFDQSLSEGDRIDLALELYQSMIFENPELFWALEGSAVITYTDGSMLILPEILSDFSTPTKLAAAKTAFNESLAEWKREAFGNDLNRMSTLEKVLSVHDLVVKKNIYHAATYNGAQDYPRRVHSAYATIVENDSVCQGIAGAINILLDYAGVENYTTVSKDHAWNRVKIGDKFYNIDATNDDWVPGVGYETEHLLFMTSDEELTDLICSAEDECNREEKTGRNRFNIMAPTAYPQEKAIWREAYAPFSWDDEANALTVLAPRIEMENDEARITGMEFAVVNIDEDGEYYVGTVHNKFNDEILGLSGIIYDSKFYAHPYTVSSQSNYYPLYSYDFATGETTEETNFELGQITGGYILQIDQNKLVPLSSTLEKPLEYFRGNGLTLPTNGVASLEVVSLPDDELDENARYYAPGLELTAKLRDGSTRTIFGLGDEEPEPEPEDVNGVQAFLGGRGDSGGNGYNDIAVFSNGYGDPIAFYQGQLVRLGFYEGGSEGDPSEGDVVVPDTGEDPEDLDDDILDDILPKAPNTGSFIDIEPAVMASAGMIVAGLIVLGFMLKGSKAHSVRSIR